MLSTVRPSGVVNRVPSDRGKLVTLIAGSKAAAFVDRGRGTTKRKTSVNLGYDRKPPRFAEDNRTTEHDLIVSIGKCEAAVTTNTRL